MCSTPRAAQAARVSCSLTSARSCIVVRSSSASGMTSRWNICSLMTSSCTRAPWVSTTQPTQSPRATWWAMVPPDWSKMSAGWAPMERIRNGSFMTRPLFPVPVLFGRQPIGHHPTCAVTIVPFRPWLPAPDQAQAVVSPPFDVPTRAEAAAMAQADRRHFLHVVRAEIDLPDEVDAGDARVYERARRNLAGLQEQGVLVRERQAELYLYRMEDGTHRQTGVVACVRAADYRSGLIRTHERTRAAQEDDRVRHMRAVGAHPEPVLFTFQASQGMRNLLARGARDEPLLAATDPDGVRHLVWRAPNPTALVAAFADVPHCYVADGHHRSAAAAQVAVAGTSTRFPAVLFPAEELRILAYNRAIRGLGDLGGEDELRRRLGQLGNLVSPTGPVPERAGSFAIRLRSGWHELHLGPVAEASGDLTASLDAERLHRTVLGPLLGVGDPRTDDRFIPVGGRDSVARLERMVDSGEASVGFSLVAPTVEQMLAVADAGAVMPPKSTWIEPKLRSGLFVHPFNED